MPEVRRSPVAAWQPGPDETGKSGGNDSEPVPIGAVLLVFLGRLVKRLPPAAVAAITAGMAETDEAAS